MKGIILAGGYGTRMKPATHVTNKHLLPIYSNSGAVPMIFYPINTLVTAGIREILVISSKDHSGAIMQNLGDGSDFNADFTYKIQDPDKVGLGVASALKLSEAFVQNEKFAVILGDNFYEDNFSEAFESFKKSEKLSMIFVKEVKDPERFGVYFNGSIEEKPEFPQSNTAVTGLYLYTKEVHSIISSLKPSKRGELEISDINNFYCQEGLAEVRTLKGFWSDMGTPASLVRTQEFLAKS